jgi:predicted acetyltransferase
MSPRSVRASDGARSTVSERRISRIDAGFASYIEAITDQTGSIRLPTGEIVPKVPFSVLWLVEGDEFIGEASIRHELNAHLLKEGATSATASVLRASARATAG